MKETRMLSKFLQPIFFSHKNSVNINPNQNQKLIKINFTAKQTIITHKMPPTQIYFRLAGTNVWQANRCASFVTRKTIERRFLFYFYGSPIAHKNPVKIHKSPFIRVLTTKIVISLPANWEMWLKLNFFRIFYCGEHSENPLSSKT